MLLKEFLTTLPEDEWALLAAAIDQLRAYSGACERFCDNLWREGQLEPTCWRGLLSVLLTSVSDEVPWRITEHIRENAREYQLRGQPYDVIRGVPIGRLSTVRDLACVIAEQDPDGILVWQAEALLDRFVFGKDPATFPRWLASMKLSLYVLWGAVGLVAIVTREQAALACCRCGLPEDMAEEDLAFFEYTLTDMEAAHVPTILDAYGGWPWPPHFTAARPDGVGYTGRTSPRPDCAEEEGLVEVVSRPVQFSSLCEPARRLGDKEGME